MELLSYLSWGPHGWGDELVRGLGVTLSLALTTLPLGLLLGLLIALASVSGRPVLQRLAQLYTATLRGIPELLTLFVVYNGAAMLLNQLARHVNPDAGFVELSPFVAGVVALGLVFSAFAAEVLRGAWLALDKGQREAARALGFTPWLGFWLVEFPPLLRLALPGLGNLWLNLLKDTALVSVIALNDLMRMASVAVGVTKQPFLFYLAVSLLYWLLCVLSEAAIGRLEQHLSRGLRRPAL
ncbi:ABC transporter permease [Pokkaliibacter plantistimulans]|uniref:ABC transporter permease n=1 Tax=Pokkaliibacter plantistimulans TaxID=1635171 RepID=A0ABX5LST7_9GAMM|nr:ABC transporter permease subunit [Pokkaliibacter plantistimulans]PXF29401.1 ABC transporter permease [Pokkaliibacter plantistimulans]